MVTSFSIEQAQTEIVQKFDIRTTLSLQLSNINHKMSRPTTILTVGLTMEAVHFITPDMDTVKLKKRLDDSMDTLKTVSNLYSDCFWIDHNAPPEAPNSVQNYKKLVDQGPPQGGKLATSQ